MAAQGTSPTETTPLLREDIHSNGTVDEEQLSDNASRPQENEGQKASTPQLKYIVPAISMGVSNTRLITVKGLTLCKIHPFESLRLISYNNCAGVSGCSRSDDHSRKLRQDWKRS